MIVITIGITQVIQTLTIPVGPLQAEPSPSTTHVHPVGVFLTAVAMVSGQKP